MEIEAATTRGRLYELPYGFPGLCVDESAVEAPGTTDYLADAQLQESVCVRDEGTRETTLVHGEVLIFEDPTTWLPVLDALEGYTPGVNGLYRRVLYPIEVNNTIIPAWLYCIPRPIGEHLPDGRWSAHQGNQGSSG